MPAGTGNIVGLRAGMPAAGLEPERTRLVLVLVYAVTRVARDVVRGLRLIDVKPVVREPNRLDGHT